MLDNPKKVYYNENNKDSGGRKRMKEENFETKPKKRGTAIVIGIILVLAIGLIGGGTYLLLKPKSLLGQSYQYIAQAFKTENSKAASILDEDAVKLDANIHIGLGNDLELGLKNIDMDLILNENKKDKVAQYKINSKVDGTEFLNIDSILKDNKIYASVENVTDKYYYTDLDFVSLFKNNQKDVKVITDIISKSIEKVITDDKIKTAEVTKVINGKEEKVKQLSLEVTTKLASEVLTDISNKIKDDDEALGALMNLTGQDEDAIVKMLDNLEVTSIGEDEVVTDPVFTYNVYYKGMNQIQMIEIVDGEEVLTYTAGNEYRFVYTSEDNTEFELTIEKGSTKKFTAVAENMKITGEFSNEKLEFTVTEEEKEIITVKIETKYSKGETIDTSSLSNAKKFDEITEEEMSSIMLNLQNNQLISSLIESFNPSSTEPEEHYPWEDDDDYNNNFNNDTTSDFNFDYQYSNGL